MLALVVLAAPAYAQQPGWEVRVPERATVAITATETVPLAIAVDRGLTISRDAPVIVDLVPEAGVTIKKRRLGRADAVDPEADAPRFAVPVRGDAAGDHAVKVRIRFWLCGGKACRPVEVRRLVTVSVTP
ncbi:MAG: hypothetical protein ABI867_26255 [Kofleriaceae bacterium]